MIAAVASWQIASSGQCGYLSPHNIAHDGRKSFRQGMKAESAQPHLLTLPVLGQSKEALREDD